MAVNGSPTPRVTGLRASWGGTDFATARFSAASCSYERRVPAFSVSAASASNATADRIADLRSCAWKAAVRSNGSLESSLPLNAVLSSGRLMMSRTTSSCHRQTPKQTTKAVTQMISRVRSSSRCSTRLRRSSCRIGRSVLDIRLGAP